VVLNLPYPHCVLFTCTYILYSLSRTNCTMRTNKTYITFSPMTSFFCHFWHSIFILYSEPRSWNPERSGSIDCASTWNTDIYQVFKPQRSLSFDYNLFYIYNNLTSICASLVYHIELYSNYNPLS